MIELKGELRKTKKSCGRTIEDNGNNERQLKLKLILE